MKKCETSNNIFCFDVLLNALTSPIVIFDRQGNYHFYNSAFATLNKEHPEFLLMDRLHSHDENNRILLKSDILSLSRGSSKVERELNLFDSTFTMTIKTIKQKNDDNSYFMVSLVDITLIKQMKTKLTMLNDQMRYLAARDNLTELLNSRGFQEEIDARFEIVKAKNRHFTIMFLDIDYFKSINDRFGHAVGDFVLKEVASMIKKHAKKSDLVCRAGGEEFIFYVENGTNESSFTVAERIRKSIESRLFVDHNYKFQITISIGIAAGDASSKSVTLVKENADFAMYQAKRAGRNQTKVFKY